MVNTPSSDQDAHFIHPCALDTSTVCSTRVLPGAIGEHVQVGVGLRCQAAVPVTKALLGSTGGAWAWSATSR
ncbi:MAG: hypothetical protein U5L00_18840 [Desulfovermiculus sp.]|nr:hypothetical protein [Desulfovermiculus sp.]